MGKRCVRRGYLRLNGDEHEGPVFFLLCLGHMGRGLFPLAFAVSGPMPFLPAAVAEGSWRRPATARVASARVLAGLAVTGRRAGAATTASTSSVLPAAAQATATTGTFLLAAGLATCLPIFFAEQQSAHTVRDLLRLAALFEHAQPPDDVLDRSRVQIEEHLERDGGLRQPIRYHLQKLLYHLDIGDIVAEDAKVDGERRDADPEFGNGLPILEGERAELATELLRAGVARAAITDPQYLDSVPRLLHGPLATERPPHFGGNRAQETRHCLAVLLVLILIRVLIDADVDSVPDAKRLVVHFHHQRPLRVVCSREHRPRDVGG
uniref:Uncharacterized protein n=1 Tax=Zea mays TaxID=4577 RepID=B4FRQ2_MAIZE|nr:unknown [Zea mays]